MNAEEIAAGMSEGERRRLLMGRTDWRDAEWQDHCGDLDCDECKGFVDDHVAPNLLSDEDKAVRAILESNHDRA